MWAIYNTIPQDVRNQPFQKSHPVSRRHHNNNIIIIQYMIMIIVSYAIPDHCYNCVQGYTLSWMGRSTSLTVPSLSLTLERVLVHSTVGLTRRSVVEQYRTDLGSSIIPMESKFPLMLEDRASIATEAASSYVWTGERASRHPQGPTDVRYPMLMMRLSRSTSLWLNKLITSCRSCDWRYSNCLDYSC